MSTSGWIDQVPVPPGEPKTIDEVGRELRQKIGDLAVILSQHIFDGPRNKLVHGSATVAHYSATAPTILTIETWHHNPYNRHGWEQVGHIVLGSYDLKDALKLIEQREALRQLDTSVLN